MESAVWAFVERSVPEARQQDIAFRRSSAGALEISGSVDVRSATCLNIAVQQFMHTSSHLQDFALTGKVSRKGLSVVVPKVRLGDVTTRREREVLTEHTKNRTYLDPESQVDMPEWNNDFVLASDRRHDEHIQPRYVRDSIDTVERVTAFIAEHCKAGRGIVVHTGAGISAAAGIATYREGSSASVEISAAMPTYSHYALVALTKVGAVDYVCSQNVDGLHRRSGLAAGKLSELHGNAYIETCCCCKPAMEFVRPDDIYSNPCEEPQFWARYVEGSHGRRKIEANVQLTENEQKSGIHHITGRACPRGGGPLRDSVIHFGENLPVDALEKGRRHARDAPLNLVIGSSLLVRPASNLPFEGSGPVVIVSMTCTGGDVRALEKGGLLLRAPADVAMQSLMRKLQLEAFSNTPELMEALHERVRARDEAVLRSGDTVPYDGGADGGVVPHSLFASSAAPMLVEAPESKLQLRQTHQRTEDDLHQWSLCLEDAQQSGIAVKGIKSVRFTLHPTFDPSVYHVLEPPFAVGPFIGWGTFAVKVEVEFQSADPKVRMRFPLSFSEPETILPFELPGSQ